MTEKVVQTPPAKRRNARTAILAAAGMLLLGLLAYGVFKFAGGGTHAPIPYADAVQYINQEKTVEGTVEATLKINSATLLYFDVGDIDKFAVFIHSNDYSHFPAGFDKLYDGKKLQVTGKIDSFKDRREIKVTQPSQIKIVGQILGEYAPTEKNLIPYTDVGGFVGQIKTVEGTVEHLNRPDEYVTWMQFKTGSTTDFQVAVFNGSYDNFPGDLEKLYMGKKIWVAGRILMYKGQPEIVARTPSQIRIIQ